MYTQFGQKVRFTILEEVARRDALDTIWVFARIRLENGETSLASFERSEYSAIKDRSAPMEALMTAQVFNSEFDIHSAFEPDPNSVLGLHIHPSYLNGDHPSSAYFWESMKATPSTLKRPSRFLSALRNMWQRVAIVKAADTPLARSFTETETNEIIQFWDKLGYIGAEKKDNSVWVPVAGGKGHVQVASNRVSLHDGAVDDRDAINAALDHARQYWGGHVTLQGSEEDKLKLWAHAVVAKLEVHGYVPPAHLGSKANALLAELQSEGGFATANDIHYAAGGAARPGWRVPMGRRGPQQTFAD